MEPWENRLQYNLDTMAQKHDDWNSVRQSAYTKQPRKTARFARPLAICASLVMLTAIGIFAYGLMQPPAELGPGTDPDANPIAAETDLPSGAPAESTVFPSIEPYDPWAQDDIVTLDLESGLYADVTPDKLEEDTGYLVMKNRETGETFVMLPDTEKAYSVSGKLNYHTGYVGEWGAIDIQYDDEIGVLFLTVRTENNGSVIISHEIIEGPSGFFYGESSVADEPICLVKLSKGKWAVYGADVMVGADVSELTVVQNDNYYGYFTLEVEPNCSAWDYVEADSDKGSDTNVNDTWNPIDKEQIITHPLGKEITWYRCNTLIHEWPGIEMKLKINGYEVVPDETDIADYSEKALPYQMQIPDDAELVYLIVNATVTNPYDYALEAHIPPGFIHNAEGEYAGHLRSFDQAQNEWQNDNSSYWLRTFKAKEALEVQYVYLVNAAALEDDMFVTVPHIVDAGTAYMDQGPYDFLQIN